MEIEHEHGPECYEKGRKFVDDLKDVFYEYKDCSNED